MVEGSVPVVVTEVEGACETLEEVETTGRLILAVQVKVERVVHITLQDVARTKSYF